MPKYTIIEQPQEDQNKYYKKKNPKNQQQYVERLRQVLQINRRNNQYYTSQVNRPPPSLKLNYKKSTPKRYHTQKQENEEEAVYIIQDDNDIHENLNQNQTMHLPKIKKRMKGGRSVKYSQIESNDKQIIRNYMNAKLIQFKNPLKDKYKKSKKKRKINDEVGQLPQNLGKKKFYTYQTHTPIQILQSESNRESYVEGNSYVRAYQKPSSSRTQNVNYKDRQNRHQQLSESAIKVERANSIDQNKYRLKYNKNKHENDEEESFKNSRIDPRYSRLINQQQLKGFKESPKKLNQSILLNPNQKQSRLSFDNKDSKHNQTISNTQNNEKFFHSKIKQEQNEQKIKQKEKKKQQDWQLVDPLNLQTFFVKAKKISNIQSSNISKIERPKFKLPQIPRRQDMSKFIRNYVPEFTQIKIDELLRSQGFQIITDEVNGKQTFYFGEAKNDKRSGKGIFITQKSLFEGIWADDQRVKGIQQTEAGKYKGEFKDGQRSGNGEFFWSHGQYYSGQWKNGKKNGSGYWRSQKDESYMGEWRNGQVTGNGVHTMKNGQKYQGQFINFLKHGFGHEQFPNGDRYEGRYVQGQAHGQGKYYWKNGTLYSGDFVEGYREGKGALIAPNRLQFEGTFKSQYIYGNGILKLANGDIFNGMLQNNKKNGHGILDMKSQKRIVKGIWQNNELINEQQ